MPRSDRRTDVSPSPAAGPGRPGSTPPLAGDVAARRATLEGIFRYADTALPHPDDVTITDHELTTADGATIPLRWYARKDATGEPGPAALYLHGSGMIAGHAGMFDGYISRYVSASGTPSCRPATGSPPSTPTRSRSRTPTPPWPGCTSTPPAWAPTRLASASSATAPAAAWPAYTIQAFASLLRVGRGRVINISAPTARVHVPFLSALVGSKAALEAMSDAIRLELDVWGIPVVVIEPGATGTGIFAKADAVAQAGLAATDPGQVELCQARFDAVAEASAAQRTRSPESVAETILAAVQARTPKRRYTAGQDARMAGLLTALPVGLRERVLRGFLGLRTSAANS